MSSPASPAREVLGIVLREPMLLAGLALTLFLLLVAFFSAYVSSHVLAPGAHYTEVFRYVGSTAFMGFALGQIPQSIWFKRQWSTTLKHVFDGLIYALLAAGTFGWLWP